MERLKTDTQETKKKVLGGYIREPFEFSFLSRAYRSRNNQMNRASSNCGQTCGQKIFGISGGAEVVGKHAILPRKCKK